MMLTIHGLSPNTRYQDLKLLIKQECGIDDFILDNLLDDGEGTKKVRVGLPDDNEGYKLMKCLDGYRTPGNFLLKVTPVGKAATANRSQEVYAPRSGYQPHQRDDYQSRTDYNTGSQGSGMQRPGPFGPSGPQPRPGRPEGPVDNIRSSWVSNNVSTQWTPNTAVSPQMAPDRFNFRPAQQNVTPGFGPQNPNRSQLRPEYRPFEQGRPGPSPGVSYGGYQPETNITSHQMDVRKNLRSIETVVGGHPASAPMHGGRYSDNQQYQQMKPVTIMKENFQGPTQYNISHPGGQSNYAQQGTPSSWQQPTHQTQQSKLQMSKEGPFEKSFESRNYPQGSNRDPKGVQTGPDVSKDFNKRRGFSPSGRVSDRDKRKMSPIGRPGDMRRLSPGRVADIRDRRVSPHGRREDLHSRRYSPSEKRISPGDRRNTSGTRRVTPPRKMSPNRRHMSPGRRDDEDRPPRFSPNRHHGGKMGVKFEQNKNLKKVRPAYEPVHAQNQAMYSDGYRPNVQDKVPYSGSRQDQAAPWQRAREEPNMKKQEHDKMDERMPLSRGRIIDKVESRYSPTRKSRSPIRRDRSPVRDRYKRSSRSPRSRSSHSPRRSWALEKRRSPDAPPPPLWPRQTDDQTRIIRPSFQEKDDPPKTLRPNISEKNDHPRTHRSNFLEKDDHPRTHRPNFPEKDEHPRTHHTNFPEKDDRARTHRPNFPEKDEPIRSHRSNFPEKDDLPRTHRSNFPEKDDHPRTYRPSFPETDDFSRSHRPNFTERTDKSIHQPVWEGRSFKEEELQNRRHDEQRQYDEAKMRIAKDLERNPQTSAQERQYQKELKFSPRNEYDERRDNFRGRDSPIKKTVRDDFPPRHREENRHENYSRGKNSPFRDGRKDIHSKEFDKDLEDIYQRALQFKKKTEEMKKITKKSDEYDFNRKQNEKERENMQMRFEDRRRYRGADSQLSREQEERHEEKPRNERPRDDRALRSDRFIQDDRPRVDEQREDRFSDYRSRNDKLRDDRMQSERTQHDDGRGGYEGRDIQEDRNKNVNDNKTKRIFFSDINIKHKRDKAINEIAEKIIDRSEAYKHVQGEQRMRILEELKMSVARIVYDMFGDSDASFIEVIIKYQAKYNLKDEEKLLQNVIKSLPNPMRTFKRHAQEPSDHPTKITRYPSSADLNPELHRRPKLSDSSFNVNLAPPNVISMPCIGVPQAQAIVNQTMFPMMVSAPFYQTFDGLQQGLQNAVYLPEPVPPVTDVSQTVAGSIDYSESVQWMDLPEEDAQDGFRLYLCRKDLDKITTMEADLLKDFIISQMINATEQFQGWSPEFTLKGLQTLYRYEVVTKDEGSKNWFLSLDFSAFEYFEVIIYTKEELWYQRAAVWLPGHSRVRNIEPLEKLRLQNKKLTGVNIGKWKFVKKIINNKGTRLYVDIPPSSARALEAHDMKLSYELQQVSVFLRAVAVDKNSFDAGMQEVSIKEPAKIIEAIQNAPMPSLPNDPKLVKIVLKGSKTLDLTQARKVKEIVVYQLFKYHQQDGLNRTDFLNFGFLQPNYFAIMPLNQESKQWLLGCSFGKVNRQTVVVIGGEEDNKKFIKMVASVPWESSLREHNVIERLKLSNAGIKGINFNLWKPIRIKPTERKRARYEVQIDMESVATLSTMQYQLDYQEHNRMHILYFSSDYSQSGLQELIKKYRNEMTDSYDVANMDLDSEQSDSEVNDDVICLD